MYDYAISATMQGDPMNTQWSNVDGPGKRCTATLSHALISMIPSYFSDTKGVEKKRYSSTAVRFPLLYYHNRLIVSQFSLRACADCVRPCARSHAHAKVYMLSCGMCNTLSSCRESINPKGLAPEFPSKHPIFGVNSRILQ